MKKRNLFFILLAAIFMPIAANAQTLFSEGFEGGSMPTGWTTDGPGTWTVGSGDYSTSTGAGLGTYNALIKHSTTGNVTKLITPEIDLSSVTSAMLSFMHVQRSWAGDIDYLKVYYRTSSSETWTQLVAYTSAVASWTTEEDILLPHTTATYQLAFEHTDNYGYGVGLDQVVIIAPSSCPKPTLGAAEYISEEGASFQWTENGSATQWQLQYSTSADFSNPTTIDRNGIPAYAITGLTPSTAYYVHVRSYCGDGEWSDWSNTVNFRTPCTAFGLPYAYGFEDAGDLNCWTVVYTANTPGINTDQAHTGSNCFRLSSYSNASSYDQYLISPMFNAANGIEFSFYYKPYDYGTEVFNVGYSTTTNEASAFIWSDDITTTAGTDWDLYEATYPAGTKYVAIYYHSNYAYYLYVDDFNFEVPSSCRKPTDLAVADITASTATLSWTENGEATAWQVEVTDLDGGQVTTWNASATTYQIVGLFEDTPYSVRVNPVCDVEKWSDPITFRTPELCPRPTNVAVSDITPISASVSWQGTATSYNLRYRELTDEDFVDITFTANDVWQDGTGYQLLLDADATAYGTIIPETGGLTSSGNASAAVYAEFEYKFPANADGAMNTQNVLIGESATIRIPAGTYDWCVTNPTPGDRIWIAGEGRADDYVFETGKAYELTVQSNGDGGDQVVVTVTEVGSSKAAGWTEINDVTSPYTITVEGGKFYRVEVQGNCGDDATSAWVSQVFETPSNCQAPTPLDATDVTTNAATLNWSGIQTEYQVQYRTAGSRELLFFEDFDNQPSTWTLTNATYDRTSSQTTDYFVFLGSGSTETAYLITPELSGFENGGTVEFAHRAYNGTPTFQVGFSTTTNDVDAFTWGDEVTAATGLFGTYSVALPNGTKYVAIRTTTEVSECAVLINDFSIYGNEIPVGDWNYATSNTNSVDINNLDSDKLYEWQVRGANASCDGGYTEWSEIATFTTLSLCMAPTDLAVTDTTGNSATLSWTPGVEGQESFNIRYRTSADAETLFYDDLTGYDVIDEEEGLYGIGDWTTVNLQEGGGNFGGQFVFYYTSNPPQYLISPELNGIEEGSTLQFSVAYYDEGYPETFKVGFSTTGNDVDNDFTWGEEVSTEGLNAQTWYTYSTAVPEGAKYFAVQCTSDDQYAFFVSNFMIYGPVTPAGEWVEVDGVTSPYTLPGLNGETWYDWHLQVDGCDEWYDGDSFETLEQTSVTQTIALSTGVNWVSFYVETDLDALKAALVAAMPVNGVAIAAQNGGRTTYNGSRWRGALNSLDLSQMYKITVPEACEITVEGMPIDPAAHPVTIRGGLNWIAFPFMENMTIANAFAGFATNGDQVKSMNDGQTAYNGSRWRGALNTLVPGKGYIYNSASTEERTFVFPTSSKGFMLYSSSSSSFSSSFGKTFNMPLNAKLQKKSQDSQQNVTTKKVKSSKNCKSIKK